MPTALVTGANRGIGLEFVRQYAGDGWRVHATCRVPGEAEDLAALAGDIAIHAMDVADGGQVAALAAALEGEAIDLLINNAATTSAGSTSFGSLDFEAWDEVMRVNALAPVRVAEAFTEHVGRSRRKLMVAITSRLGSIAETGGGYIVYGSSKAALNFAMKSLAGTLSGRGIATVVLHPGWVMTRMGGSGAPTPVAESVGAMRAVIDGLGPGDSGRFLGYDGEDVPW